MAKLTHYQRRKEKIMSKSLKTLLGFGLLGFIGVWIGCSSDSSPVAPPHPAGKTHLTSQDPTDPAPTYVTFADSSLERAVRTALGAQVGGDPTSSLTDPTVPPLRVTDLATLTTLNARSRGIQSLAGLEHATNLTALMLDNNSIADISDLAGLTKLEYLSLMGNSIAGIDSLADLPKLEYLYLTSNSITDLSPLADLPKLKHLYLTSNSITDLSPLAGPLADLPKLEYLYLASNSITDLSPLASLTKLKRLALGGNPFGGDLSDLAGLTELEWLMVNWTGVTDLSPLEGLTKLTYLDISSNSGITDFSPLTCLVPTLKNLALRGMPFFQIDAAGGKVPKQDQTDLLYLVAKGVAINFE